MKYKLIIQQYNIVNNNYETKIEYVLAENKKELWAYIGYLYSSQICKIERIDYFFLSYQEYEKIKHFVNINKKLKQYENEKER